MTRNANDRMIDSYVYLDFDSHRIHAGVYVSGKYHYISGYWFYSAVATAIYEYLMNPDGSSTAMAGAQ